MRVLDFIAFDGILAAGAGIVWWVYANLSLPTTLFAAGIVVTCIAYFYSDNEEVIEPAVEEHESE